MAAKATQRSAMPGKVKAASAPPPSEAFRHLLDDVLLEHIDLYFSRIANEDDRHNLSRFLVSFARFCDANAGRSDRMASEARANARAAMIAAVDAPLAAEAALAAPLHQGEATQAMLGDLRPSEYDALEDQVLALYLAHAAERGARYYAAQRVREAAVAADRASPTRGSISEERSDAQLTNEALVQFYAGNIVRPSHFALLADWFAGVSAREQSAAVATMRRLASALLASPYRDEFPWRTAVFAFYLPEHTLRERFGGDGPASAPGSPGSGAGAAANGNDGGDDDDDRPPTPTIAGLSTRKINKWTHDANSARFDAHGSSRLSDAELADLKARLPQQRSVYGLSYESLPRRPDARSYAEANRAVHRGSSLRLGLERKLDDVTTYQEHVGQLGGKILDDNAAAGRTRDYTVRKLPPKTRRS